jgi:peroxiredoxin
VKHPPLIVIAVAVAAAGAGYIAAMLSDRAQPEPTATGQAQPGPEDLLGRRRPDFSLVDTGGKPVRAADFDGQVWLLNFWATWCAPCVEEMPMLSRLHRERGGGGLTVVGVALDEPQNARDFAAELGVEYPILVGFTDTVQTGRRYGNRGGMLPYSVLIDAGGTVRWTHLGALDRDQLLAEAARLPRNN